MSTLTIPFSNASANVESKKVIIDTLDFVTLQQESNTSTILYVSNSNAGTITLTHDSAPNGAVGNSINKALINSVPGDIIVNLPSGVNITNVTYN